MTCKKEICYMISTQIFHTWKNRKNHYQNHPTWILNFFTNCSSKPTMKNTYFPRLPDAFHCLHTYPHHASNPCAWMFFFLGSPFFKTMGCAIPTNGIGPLSRPEANPNLTSHPNLRKILEVSWVSATKKALKKRKRKQQNDSTCKA